MDRSLARTTVGFPTVDAVHRLGWPFHGVDDTGADIRELILPTTDAGVAIQLVLVVVTGALAWVLLRRHPDARLLVVGTTLFGLGLIGLRALH